MTKKFTLLLCALLGIFAVENAHSQIFTEGPIQARVQILGPVFEGIEAVSEAYDDMVDRLEEYGNEKGLTPTDLSEFRTSEETIFVGWFDFYEAHNNLMVRLEEYGNEKGLTPTDLSEFDPPGESMYVGWYDFDDDEEWIASRRAAMDTPPEDLEPRGDPPRRGSNGPNRRSRYIRRGAAGAGIVSAAGTLIGVFACDNPQIGE